MNGRVVHFEVPYDDRERAEEFYASAFGWKLQTWADGDYTMVTTGPTDEGGPPSEPGFINGGMMSREEPVGTPVIVVEVDDIDTALAEIERLGGRTAVPRQPVGDIGFSAYFTDPEGNLLGLWQSARRR
jgi:predicted enzyme related to lactoylglutathione lyase